MIDKQASLEQRFQDAAQKWRRDTRLQSSSTRIQSHPSYQEIVEMGPDVVPLLLQKVKNDPSRRWFGALRTITRADPTTSASTFQECVDAWLQWGKDEGYLE